MIFGHNRKDGKDGPPVRVGVSIQGLMGADYLSVIADLEMPAGSVVRDLVDELRKRGDVDDKVYAMLKGVKPPLTLLVNGNSLAGRKRDRTRLSDGDKVTIMTPATGG